MLSVIARVVARWKESQLQTAPSEEGQPKKRKGPPARWQEWLEVVHQSGKKKVPNPNWETRDKNPQVTFNTALKDKKFYQSALEDYLKWVGKHPEGGKAKKGPVQDEEEAPSKAPAPEEPSAPSKPPPKKEPKEEPGKETPEERARTEALVEQAAKRLKEPEPSEEHGESPEERAETEALVEQAAKRLLEKPEEPPTEEPPTEESAPEQETPSFDLKKTFALSDEDIDRAAQKHQANFEKLTSSIKEELSKYEEGVKNDPIMSRYFLGLSEQEKLIHVGGYLVGRYFQKNVLNKRLGKLHQNVLDGWQRASSGYWMCHLLHGALSSMGVPGSLSPRDKRDEALPLDERQRKSGVLKISQARKKGAASKEVQEYLKEVYTFQQAYFRHLGLKELTVYRGVSGQGIDEDPPSVGDAVQFGTRELSSFSTNPKSADTFGRTVVFKVPIERVWATSCVRPNFGLDPETRFAKDAVEEGESEVMVIGASELKGEILSRPEGLET
jgi:hypothetical protein